MKIVVERKSKNNVCSISFCRIIDNAREKLNAMQQAMQQADDAKMAFREHITLDVVRRTVYLNNQGHLAMQTLNVNKNG